MSTIGKILLVGGILGTGYYFLVYKKKKAPVVDYKAEMKRPLIKKTFAKQAAQV